MIETLLNEPLLRIERHSDHLMLFIKNEERISSEHLRRYVDRLAPFLGEERTALIVEVPNDVDLEYSAFYREAPQLGLAPRIRSLAFVTTDEPMERILSMYFRYFPPGVPHSIHRTHAEAKHWVATVDRPL